MAFKPVKPTKEDQIYAIDEVWKTYKKTRKNEDWSVECDILVDLQQEIKLLQGLYDQDTNNDHSLKWLDDIVDQEHPAKADKIKYWVNEIVCISRNLLPETERQKQELDIPFEIRRIKNVCLNIEELFKGESNKKT